jgi:hypothetical protein
MHVCQVKTYFIDLSKVMYAHLGDHYEILTVMYHILYYFVLFHHYTINQF